MECKPVSSGVNRRRRFYCPSFLLLIALAAPAHAAPPVPVTDTPSVPEDSVNFVINAAGNDTDPDGNLDPNSTTLNTGAGNGVATSNGNGTFNYTPTANYFGPDSFTYQICDFALECAIGTVNITVTPVNDPPTLTLNGSATVNLNVGDTYVEAGASASDIEDGNLSGSVVIGGDTVNTGAAGTYIVTYNVTDSGGLSAPQVTRTVNVNAPPVITVLGDNPATVGQGQVYNDAGATASDLEDGNLTGSIVTDNPVDTSTPGGYVVTYTVTDSNGAQDIETRNVTVGANQAPTITGQSVIATDEDVAVELVLANFTISDPDSTVFTLTVLDGTNYTRNNNTITPALDFSGDLTVPVRVNDGFNDSPIFNATVTVNSVNDQPVLNGFLVPRVIDEDTSTSIQVQQLSVTDADSSNFSLTLSPGANYTLVGNVVTPTENFNGNLLVSATVTDDSGAPNATSAPANLVITVDPVNDFPMLVLPIDDQNAVEATLFRLDISGNFTDADGDNLTYTVNPADLPVSGNIRFNSNTGVFSGTPQLEDARDNAPYVITVTATDGEPGTVPAVDQFNLVIAALDRANVSLDISVTPDPGMLNDQLRWTFNVRNALGQQSAANVELNGSFFGSGLTTSSSSGCTIQPPSGQVTTFNCVIGGIPPGGLTSIVLSTDTSMVGDVATFAIAAGINPVPIDPNMADNSAQSAVGVAEVFSNGAVQILGNTNVLSVAAGDIDGDGSADLVVGTAAGQPVQVYLSDGFRGYALSPISIADNNANEGVAVADFDNNGTNDIVVANGGGQPDMVYSNNGGASFSPMATLGSTFGQDVAVGDFDNDGNADIAIATSQENPVYLGNGSGGFNLHRELGTANSRAVAVGRFDNNARDDLAFANVGSDSRVWTKNSGAGFTSRDRIAIGDASSVTVGAFGGNARDDLAFGRIPSGIGDVPANAVLINNGSASFGNPVELLGAAPTDDIHAGDVNSDGVDDLVFINASGVHQIWMANGGGFELHSEQIADRDSVAGVLTELGFADVGEPGGVDLAMGGALQGGVGVFLNDGFGNLGRGDAVVPVLTLLGENPASVPSGTSYSDAGATALDNIDGNITASIRVTSDVNTSIVGTYTVTYNVSDFAGNTAAPITRTVDVTPASGTGGGGGGALSFILIAGLLLITLLRLADAQARRPGKVVVRIYRGNRQ